MDLLRILLWRELDGRLSGFFSLFGPCVIAFVCGQPVGEEWLDMSILTAILWLGIGDQLRPLRDSC